MIFDVFTIQKPRSIQIGVSMTYTAEHVSAASSPKRAVAFVRQQRALT